MEKMPLENDNALRLSELAEARASGEFVCEDGGAEVHLFLKDGRIAWATDSRHLAAFNRYLKEQAHVDDESMAAVVAECRQSKASLSATLVAWNLATLEQVRAALRQQIGPAIASVVRSSPAAKTIFLSKYNNSWYNTQFAFEVQEFLASTETTAPSRKSPECAAGGRLSPLNGDQAKSSTANVPLPVEVAPANVEPTSGATDNTVATPAPRSEALHNIALIAEVKSAVHTDFRGALLDSIREADAENVAAVMGFLMNTMTQSGDQLGLGLLHKITVTGEKTSSLVVVEGDSIIYASIEPSAAIAAAEKALNASPRLSEV